jgi:hypothetical protein
VNRKVVSFLAVGVIAVMAVFALWRQLRPPSEGEIRTLFGALHPGIRVASVELGRRFDIDQDYFPPGTAPGGRPIPPGTAFYPVRLIVQPGNADAFAWVYRDGLGGWRLAGTPVDFDLREFHELQDLRRGE